VSAPVSATSSTDTAAATAVVDAVHGEILADTAVPEFDRIISAVRRRCPLASDAEVTMLVDQVLARVSGFGALDALLDDDEVTEVMINAGRQVWVERRGELQLRAVLAEGEAMRIIERVVAPLGLRIDRSSPIVDARLPTGERVHAVVPPVAVDGPILCVRRFAARGVELDSFCSPQVASLLADAVRDKRNMVVSGGTGSGKTTMLNALASAIDPRERIVTIEDAAELSLRAPHVVRLEARPSNADGVAAVPIRALVRASLRMRPDRVIVGEVRGGETLDMLQAMNTGHEGSMSTCHANSARDALRRLETMVLFDDAALPLDAVRAQIAAAVDVVVQLRRLPGGRRVVVEVVEVGALGGHGTDDAGCVDHQARSGSARSAEELSVRLIADGDTVHAPWHRPARR
jgi:pilus assembly protein CpaF